MMKYEVIDHTADVAIKAYGKDLNEIFENAALGMFDLITDASSVRAVGEYEISLNSLDLESLMVDWLSELLFLHETQNLLLSDFEVNIEDTRLKARVRGEAIDLKRHPLNIAIKAVTYHMIEVNEKEGYAFVLFDI